MTIALVVVAVGLLWLVASAHWRINQLEAHLVSRPDDGAKPSRIIAVWNDGKLVRLIGPNEGDEVSAMLRWWRATAPKADDTERSTWPH